MEIAYYMELITKYFTHLTSMQVQQFSALKNLYKEWNEKINVISRKDMENFYEHHVLHSLAIAKKFSFPDGTEIMDLGTGGGFPGIPLAIYFPSVKFHLADSINKKLKVVNEIVNAVKLKNVTTQHSRAEEIRDKKFDVVISRAVAPLKDLCKWSKPLIKNKQHTRNEKLQGLICLKGGDIESEIADSGYSFRVYNIDGIFQEEFFKEKYILFTKL
jgi:16S rRNA (guanine527-N7)-methyltransferase